MGGSWDGRVSLATGIIHGVLVLSPYIRRLSMERARLYLLRTGVAKRHGNLETRVIVIGGGAGQECIYATVICLDRGHCVMKSTFLLVVGGEKIVNILVFLNGDIVA